MIAVNILWEIEARLYKAGRPTIAPHALLPISAGKPIPINEIWWTSWQDRSFSSHFRTAMEEAHIRGRSPCPKEAVMHLVAILCRSSFPSQPA